LRDTLRYAAGDAIITVAEGSSKFCYDGSRGEVLVPMMEKWKPSSNEADDYMGIDLYLPLLHMGKGWQESEANMTHGSILAPRRRQGKHPGAVCGAVAEEGSKFWNSEGKDI
jgi:hypothetical protein